MVCEYGQGQFALRVPADCLDIVLGELDETEVKWLNDEKLPSQIRDALRANYEFAEKQGGRPCLIIYPMMRLMTWGMPFSVAMTSFIFTISPVCLLVPIMKLRF